MSDSDHPPSSPIHNGTGSGAPGPGGPDPGTGGSEPGHHPVTPLTGAASPMPFEGLQAPAPTTAAPPVGARWLAFGSIVVGGLLGALIGYGTGDLMGGTALWASVGLVVGALAGALGVGVVAALTLRAMNEWHAANHPEARSRTDAKGFELRPGVGPTTGRNAGRTRSSRRRPA